METFSTKQERIKLLNYATNIMKKGKRIYHPSRFWEVFGKKNNEQFIKDGFENMKIRQGLDYFQFLIFEWSYWQFQYVWKKSSLKTKLQAILPALTSPGFQDFPMEERQRWLFVYYHCLLWDYVKKRDTRNLLCLEEPRYGNPLLVRWRNHTFTQDLLNSILETYSMLEALENTNKQPETILEAGGGYGRNMYVLKKVFPRSKIIMVDIPPAIMLAQWYMTKVFPDSKIVGISDFKKFSEIQKAYAVADFVFLLPHQIELIPDKSIHLFVNVNSFQEMTFKQIETYFSQIDRLTKGVFYTKQWKQQDNQIDNIKINEHEYPVHDSWEELFHREAQIQSRFFEAAYKI